MRKAVKQIVLLAVLCLSLVALTLCVSAETYAGECGDNLTYTLDTDAGTLNIVGMGAMTDWEEAPWYWAHESIHAVTIADGVTSIGECAFADCTNLTSITIPNSVISIGRYAFHGCWSLSGIQLPNRLQSIKFWAFRECHSLTSVKIPSTVTNIGEGAFSDCYSLTSICVDADNQNYCSEGNVLFDKAKTVLIFAAKGISGLYTVPKGTTIIAGEAFSHCRKLTGIAMPGSVTSIGNYAFSDCTNLASVTIPSSVKSIGDGAFSYCSGLTNITISEGVTSIGGKYMKSVV